MSKNISRRDLLKFLGGATAGIFLSPLPWKLLDDSSIWTQNWPWTPIPLKGKLEYKFTTCTLCPMGCGLKVKCVANQPVGISGVANHPMGLGTACPVGLAGHHYPFHPLRLVRPAFCNRNGETITLNHIPLNDITTQLAHVISEIQDDPNGEKIAVLDNRPGRTVSLLYKQFLEELECGVYITPKMQEDASLMALNSTFNQPFSGLGYDLQNVRTILNFGAPLSESWQGTGKTLKYLRNNNYRIKIIQAGAQAGWLKPITDEWLPLKPGTEAALALGIAHILISEDLSDGRFLQKSKDFKSNYLPLVKKFTPEHVSNITGIAQEKIIILARELAKNKPTLIMANADSATGSLGKAENLAIAGLNLLLDAVGNEGGILARKKVPVPENLKAPLPCSNLADIADNSIRLLILDSVDSDGVIPWKLLERKLVPEGSVVVSLSPYLGGLARYADYFVPAPAFMESWQEASSAQNAIVASYGLSAPLMTAPEGITEPINFLINLSTKAGLTSIPQEHPSSLLQQRVAAIYESGRGRVFESEYGKFHKLTDIYSADDLWQYLEEGGCWIDEPAVMKKLPDFDLCGKEKENLPVLLANNETTSTSNYPLILMPFGQNGAMANHQISPVLTKLFQESNLKPSANQAFVHPETAKLFGLKTGSKAKIKTEHGGSLVEIRLNATIKPGVILAAIAPNALGFLKTNSIKSDTPLEICNLTNDANWRVTPAKIEKVA